MSGSFSFYRRQSLQINFQFSAFFDIYKRPHWAKKKQHSSSPEDKKREQVQKEDKRAFVGAGKLGALDTRKFMGGIHNVSAAPGSTQSRNHVLRNHRRANLSTG